MLSALVFGFLIGLRHALDADHVMAVATLAADRNPRGAIRQGVVWGVGHTLTLMGVGGVVLYADTLIPADIARALEFMVGLMLIALGGDLIRRVVTNRWHVHTHEHADGHRHMHLHSHDEETVNLPVRHDHFHPRQLPLRALFIGMMHGLAGSAALVLLTLKAVQSPLLGFFYIILFGLGSIAGMALLSICITVPMNHPRLQTALLRTGLSCTIGLLTLCLGAFTVYNIGLFGGLSLG